MPRPVTCQTTHCSGTPAGWGNYPKHCETCASHLSARALVRFAAQLVGHDAVAHVDRSLSRGVMPGGER
jgi:hypothetical protein